MNRLLKPLLAVLALVCLSCGVGETAYQDFVNIDSDGLPATPTWKNDVQPRLNYYCTGCHDPNGSAGALRNLDLTNEMVVCQNDLLIQTSILDQSMPPGDMRKMTPRDYAILARWQAQQQQEGGICATATPTP